MGELESAFGGEDGVVGGAAAGGVGVGFDDHGFLALPGLRVTFFAFLSSERSMSAMLTPAATHRVKAKYKRSAASNATSSLVSARQSSSASSKILERKSSWSLNSLRV
jgi:hypothetical protein